MEGVVEWVLIAKALTEGRLADQRQIGLTVLTTGVFVSLISLLDDGRFSGEWKS
jgi:hypothetical protein